MRGSLLLSILQQSLQEEKLPSVKSSVTKSLSLIFAYLRDEDKYRQVRHFCKVSIITRFEISLENNWTVYSFTTLYEVGVFQIFNKFPQPYCKSVETNVENTFKDV